MDPSEFRRQLRALIDAAREKAKDGLTWAEAGQLFVSFLQVAVESAAGLSLPGATKKEFVLAAVAELYDAVAPFVPLPWFLAPVRGILTKRFRDVVLRLADGAVEAVYFWWKNRSPNPDAA
jgi:hypothetical protein